MFTTILKIQSDSKRKNQLFFLKLKLKRQQLFSFILNALNFEKFINR
jgi:hypothetical protein